MAFSQGFQEGHNGVVEEDDDYGKTKADGGGGSLLLYAQGSSYDAKTKLAMGREKRRCTSIIMGVVSAWAAA